MNQSAFDLADRTISADVSPRTPSRPPLRASGLILIAAGIVSLCAMNGCAPAPKYRALAEASGLAARETTSREGGMPDLGTRPYPPVMGFSPARITGPFGIRASNCRRHDGVDMGAKPGEEILAAASGMVALSGRKRGYGNVVILDHGNGVSTLYAHLFYACAREGESIGTGEAIGRAGKRGRATGTHLHFEVRRSGSPIDPVPHL